MSDLKITDGDDTVEFQLDAALGREAALREELASKTKMLKAEQKWFDREIDSADEETSALRECIRDLKDWREHSQSLSAFASIIARAEAVIPAPGPLRKALTAAEQRNAAFQDAAIEVISNLGEHCCGLQSQSDVDYITEQLDKLAVLIKPTEARAVE